MSDRTRGHTSRRQVAIAVSSRSTGRCLGISGPNPMRCNNSDTPRRVPLPVQPGDQLGHPDQGPALVLAIAVRGRTLSSASANPASSALDSRQPAAGSRYRTGPSTPGRSHRRPAAAATHTPRCVIPEAAWRSPVPARPARTMPPPATGSPHVEPGPRPSAHDHRDSAPEPDTPPIDNGHVDTRAALVLALKIQPL